MTTAKEKGVGILKSKTAAVETAAATPDLDAGVQPAGYKIPLTQKRVHSPFRMSGMTLLTAALLVAVYFMARQQIGLLAFKACFISGAAALGYAVDRALFPTTRPHSIAEVDLRWRYEWRRAGIVAAAMLTAGLGS